MYPQKDEVYLNLVLEYIPETVYKVSRHYNRSKQTIPISFIKVRSVMWDGTVDSRSRPDAPADTAQPASSWE